MEGVGRRARIVAFRVERGGVRHDSGDLDNGNISVALTCRANDTGSPPGACPRLEPGWREPLPAAGAASHPLLDAYANVEEIEDASLHFGCRVGEHLLGAP